MVYGCYWYFKILHLKNQCFCYQDFNCCTRKTAFKLCKIKTGCLSLKVVFVVSIVTMSSICLDFFTPVESYSAGNSVKLGSPIINNAEHVFRFCLGSHHWSLHWSWWTCRTACRLKGTTSAPPPARHLPRWAARSSWWALSQVTVLLT